MLTSLQIGERQHVLVTEESFDAQFYVAHNKFYEQVRKPFTLVTNDVDLHRKASFDPHSLHH